MIEEFETEDGSITYFNAKVGEHYHSKTGAFLEAQEKYAVACKVGERAKKGKLVFFDICFGLGYNTYFGIKAALKENPDCEITVHCFENDKEILKKIPNLPIDDKIYELLKKSVFHSLEKKEGGTAQYIHKKITIIMHLGDVQETIDKVKESADCVFFDPFSPKKMPNLWSAQLFEKVFVRMKKESVLATYSCARVVRDNMKTAGFIVEDGPGRRKMVSLYTGI